MEPIFALEAERSIRDERQQSRDVVVSDFAFRQWRERGGAPSAPPDSFVTADALSGEAHLAMQASLQPFVDNAISKTITLSPGATADTVDEIFRRSHAAGIKGCTVFRAGVDARAGDPHA